MNNSIICLPKTGQTTCYNESSDNITCTGTGQDGEIQAGVAWPSPRFTDHSDGAALDNLTGLTWVKDANLIVTRDPSFDVDDTAGDGAVTWQHALDYVKKLNTDSYLGHNDWRLPNMNELESLIDSEKSGPALPQTNPFTNVQLNYYWSSTTLGTTAAWSVIIDFDGSFGWTGKADYGFVLPVRGGQVGGSSDTSTTTTTASSVSTTTTTTPSGTQCPAQTALGEQANELQPLRAFRDRVMKTSAQGIVYVEMYYRHAPEISSLLEAHPKLKEETQRLIMQLLPMVKALLAQKEAMIDAGNVTQAAALLDNLSALGSPSLRADLVLLKKEMQSGRLFEELK